MPIPGRAPVLASRLVASLERALRAVRTATAGLALGVALLLLLRIPIVETFRAALIVLAALELLSFGHRTLSGRSGVAAWVGLAVKLAVLAGAYVVLAS